MDGLSEQLRVLTSSIATFLPQGELYSADCGRPGTGHRWNYNIPVFLRYVHYTIEFSGRHQTWRLVSSVDLFVVRRDLQHSTREILSLHAHQSSNRQVRESLRSAANT